MAELPNESVPTAPHAPADPDRWRRGARWFLAEFAVVVSGVLVALALNAWWGARQDQALERTYLRQLLADTQATQRLIAEADSAMQSSDRAGGQLVRAYQISVPQVDSLDVWLRRASRYRFPNAVTSTAEALVTTGDLALIRDDQLRADIIRYLNESRLLAADFRNDATRWETAHDDLHRIVDYQEVLATTMTPSQIEGAALRYPDFPLPAGERAGRFAFDREAFLQSRAAYDALVRMNSVKTNMRWDREALKEATRLLSERIEQTATN